MEDTWKGGMRGGPVLVWQGQGKGGKFESSTSVQTCKPQFKPVKFLADSERGRKRKRDEAIISKKL